MKGPMTTQSLRGMADAGPMHWRGDRTDPSNPLDEALAFKKFEPAFQNLLGGQISDMDAFTRFTLTLRYPPNPVRALGNSLTAAQTSGAIFYAGTPVDGGLRCIFCHALDPVNRFFGTDGFSSFDAQVQEFKIPHLRNLYAKIGRFGMPPDAFLGIPAHTAAGEQVRGFGFLHDGSVSSLDDFFKASAFQFPNQTAIDNMVAFMLAFDTGLAPAVGQQVTATATTFTDMTVVGHITLLLGRADAGDCDLVAKGVAAGVARGWLHDAATGPGLFRSDRASEPLVAEGVLRAQAAVAGQELTYTCVPPGSGVRIALDRDEDGVFDRTEIDMGTNPAVAPTTTSTTITTTTSTSSSTSSSSSTTTSSTTSSSGVTMGGGSDGQHGPHPTFFVVTSTFRIPTYNSLPPIIPPRPGDPFQQKP
jgi:hypothetical protein